MTDRRNVIVGLFVLFGLLLLGGLIIWFEDVGVLIRGRYKVKGHLPSARDVRKGKRVYMDGIEIGGVHDVTSSQPEKQGVWVDMRINPDVSIPQDAILVAQQSTVGDLYIDFLTPTRLHGSWEVVEKAEDVPGGRHIRCHFQEAVDVRRGHRVHMDGNLIGTVFDVTWSWPEKRGIWIRVPIGPDVQVPDQAQLIALVPATGEPALTFQTAGKPMVAYLPIDGTAEVEGVVRPPTLLPEELVTSLTELAEPRTLADVKNKGMAPNLSTAMEQLQITADNVAAFTKPPEGWNVEGKNLWTLAAELQATAANLKQFTEPRTLEDLKKDKNLKKNLWTMLEKVDAVVTHTRDQLENPESDFGQFMKNARQSAEKFNKTLEKADKAFASLQDAGDAAKEATTDLQNDLKAFLAGEGKAQGTIPKLIKDDELHRALVTVIENLNSTLDKFKRTLDFYRKEGLGAKEP